MDLSKADKATKPQQPSDPRVGILMKKGRPMYYAYVGRRYVEDRDLAKVEAALRGAS